MSGFPSASRNPPVPRKKPRRVCPGEATHPRRRQKPRSSIRRRGGEPIFFSRAEGAYLYDLDGNRYIDYIGSCGPMIVGHAHEEVLAAIHEVAARGTSFGASTEAESELAELIIDAVPSVERVRLISSGAEATMGALRTTFVMLLSKGGVSPRTRQAAAHHSDIDLTMNTYTDPKRLDVHGALSVLPALPLQIDAKPHAPADAPHVPPATGCAPHVRIHVRHSDSTGQNVASLVKMAFEAAESRSPGECDVTSVTVRDEHDLSCLTKKRKTGDEGDRTLNPRLAKPMLSQLSYVPERMRPPLMGVISRGYIVRRGFEVAKRRVCPSRKDPLLRPRKFGTGRKAAMGRTRSTSVIAI